MQHAIVVAAVIAGGGLAALAMPQQQQSPGGGRLNQTGNAASNLVPLDKWQPAHLPALPKGMTLAMIRGGDSVFHGPGGCYTCHGMDAMGLPDKGSALSLGLNFIPKQWETIDSLVTAGIPEDLTRSSIAMPPRGVGSNLTPDQIRLVAAYVWAISQTADEPWPGGHRSHGTEKASNAGEQ